MDILLWWIKWTVIVLGIWTVVGVIAGLLFGQFIRRGRNRRRRDGHGGWRRFNGK